MTRHGYVAYSNGCRCKVCREAKAAYLREKRADAGRRRRLVESGGGRYLATGITHGYNGYQDYV